MDKFLYSARILAWFSRICGILALVAAVLMTAAWSCSDGTPVPGIVVFALDLAWVVCAWGSWLWATFFEEKSEIIVASASSLHAAASELKRIRMALDRGAEPPSGAGGHGGQSSASREMARKTPVGPDEADIAFLLSEDDHTDPEAEDREA